jgi:hypothetical protein
MKAPYVGAFFHTSASHGPASLKGPKTDALCRLSFSRGAPFGKDSAALARRFTGFGKRGWLTALMKNLIKY